VLLLLLNVLLLLLGGLALPLPLLPLAQSPQVLVPPLVGDPAPVDQQRVAAAAGRQEGGRVGSGSWREAAPEGASEAERLHGAIGSPAPHPSAATRGTIMV
jgi:hypothetical protein